MEINEYVRTSNNINNPSFVAKIIKIENKKMIFGGLGLWITFDNKKEGFYENIITKHSKDIIDIIEVGDYVNGYQVIEKPYMYHDIQFVSVDTQDSWSWGKGEIPVENIKSIVTKEQFEVNAYTIEKER